MGRAAVHPAYQRSGCGWSVAELIKGRSKGKAREFPALHPPSCRGSPTSKGPRGCPERDPAEDSFRGGMLFSNQCLTHSPVLSWLRRCPTKESSPLLPPPQVWPPAPDPFPTKNARSFSKQGLGPKCSGGPCSHQTLFPTYRHPRLKVP